MRQCRLNRSVVVGIVLFVGSSRIWAAESAWTGDAVITGKLIAESRFQEPPPQPPPRKGERAHDIGAKLDEYLERLTGFGFSGAILLAKDGNVVLSKGYGLADREKGIAATPDTVFTIGSITKQFTAAAILKLEMLGKLSVNDQITKFFENVPDDKHDITIHHLLTHTAGFSDALGDDFDLQATRDWMIEHALKSKLLWKPGTQYEYSNVGYSLLGIIVEKVSGQGYEEFLTEQLFKPAGMTRTGYLLPKFKPEHLATGYLDGEPWGTVIGHPMLPDGPCWNLRANGGIHSTVGDMYKWHLALEGDRILSPEARKKMFTSHVPEGPDADSFYGYGWAIFTTPRGTKLVAHNGGNGVFSADFRRYVDENVVFFLAINVSDFFVDAVSSQVAKVIFGYPYTLPPKTVKLDPAKLHRHIGSYRVRNDGGVMWLATDGRVLVLEPQDQDAISLLSPGRQMSPDLLRKFNSRTATIIERSAAGDFALLSEAFRKTIPPEEVTATETAQWQARRDRLGEFQGVAVLGSVPYRVQMIATTARLDFERGYEFLRYGWLGDELAGVRTLSRAPLFKFSPVSDTEFALYNLEPAYVIRVRLLPPNSKEPARLAIEIDGKKTVAWK